MTGRALLLPLAGATALPLAGGSADPAIIAQLSLCGAALGAIAAIDLSQYRVPNRLALPAAAACTAMSVIASTSAQAPLPSVAIVGVPLLIALARPAALGMGDVKLALLIVVGLDGDASPALAAGLLLAALAGLVVIARSGRAAARTALPLAPFLALGSFLALLP
ncbi:MAG: prepilin peptidase [Solirubrobacteraceae bacterium]